MTSPLGAGGAPASSGAASPGLVPGRDRYLDLLRGIALVRVFTYHAFSAAWLSWAFPAMGVMFAIAGSLIARALSNRPAPGVLTGRFRRLLLPLWVYSATVLGLLLVAGWRPWSDGVSWGRIALWFIPIGTPPVPDDVGFFALFDTDWADGAQVILWYLRTYFWFVLLSPLMLRAFRRAPWVTLLAPLGGLAVLTGGLVALPEWATSPVSDFLVFGSCWLLGFAHRLGLLQGIRRRVVVLLGVGMMAAGLWWALPNFGGGLPYLDDLPATYALWSLGFSALLLRLSPSWQSLPRPIAFLDPAVTLVNNRALTIYLWHNLLLLVAGAVVGTWSTTQILRGVAPRLLDSDWTPFLLAWLFVGVAIFAVGWVEDVAARRPPRLWPDRPHHGSHRPGRAGWLYAGLALSTLALVGVWWYSSYFWVRPPGWEVARTLALALVVALSVALAVAVRFDPPALLGAAAISVTILLGYGLLSTMSDVTDKRLPLRERAAQIGDELGFAALLPPSPPIRLEAGDPRVDLSEDSLVVTYDAFSVDESRVDSVQTADDLESFIGVEEDDTVVVDEPQRLTVRGRPSLAVTWREGDHPPSRILVFQADGIVVRVEAWPDGDRPSGDTALQLDQLVRLAGSFEPARQPSVP